MRSASVSSPAMHAFSEPQIDQLIAIGFGLALLVWDYTTLVGGLFLFTMW